MRKALILIVGLPGSGKSFAADVIRRRFQAKKLETGDVIRAELRRRGWKYMPENDAKMRLWFHSGREHLIVQRLWDKMKNYKGVVVIDGLRSPKELAMLKRLFKGDVFLIKITSSFSVRARRSIKRGRFGRLESAKALRQRDISELGELVGMRQLLKRADYTIDNSRLTKKQMERRVAGLVGSLLRKTT
jgi:dephospho-CoA kinase